MLKGLVQKNAFSRRRGGGGKAVCGRKDRRTGQGSPGPGRAGRRVFFLAAASQGLSGVRSGVLCPGEKGGVFTGRG